MTVLFHIDRRAAEITGHVVAEFRFRARKIGGMNSAAAGGLRQGIHQFVEAAHEPFNGISAAYRLVECDGFARVHKRSTTGVDGVVC